MASDSSEQKIADATKPKGEAMARALTKLYRLAYESMENGYEANETKAKYNQLATEFPAILPPKYSLPLTTIIKELLSNATDRNIYQQADPKIEKKEPKVALVEYCEADNIDQALLLILDYKLQKKSATDIMNYVHSVSAGWSSYSYAAIHKALGKISRSEYEYQNKESIKKKFQIEEVPYSLEEDEKKKIEERNTPKKAKRDAYVESIIDSKYDRTALLIEIFLREKTSTTLKSDASGWRVRAVNETVFNQALATDNMDILRAIFKYGIDIDIDTKCTSGGSTMRTDWSSSWKPIHTAIEKGNYELVKLIIARGANINCYRTERMSNEYGSRQDEQKTALYVICSKLDDKNKMLKLILQTHEQKHNGIPDVNKFNCFVTNESKPKDVHKKEKKDAKRRQKEQEAQYRAESGEAAAATEDNDDDEDNGWDDPRSGHYVNPYVNLYNYETTMHVAIRKLDVEMVKLLLIYGSDITLCNVKTPLGYGGYGGYYNKNKEDRSQLMRNWYDKFIKKKGMAKYETVKDVYSILQEVKGDEKVKGKIKRIFDTKSIFFPEMLEFYPNNMGKALETIMNAMSDVLPLVIINMVIEYFYNIVEEEVIKEADEEVDISNVKQ